MNGEFSSWFACVACLVALWCAACERAIDRTCESATTTIQLRTLANPDAMDDDDVERIVDSKGDLDHMPGHDWLLLYDEFSWIAYEVDPTDVFGDGSGNSDTIGIIHSEPGWRIVAMRDGGDLYVLAREIERCGDSAVGGGGDSEKPEKEVTTADIDVSKVMVTRDIMGRVVPGVVVCERSMPCFRRLSEDQRGRPIAIVHEDTALSITWPGGEAPIEFHFPGLFPLDVAQDVIRKLD